MSGSHHIVPVKYYVTTLVVLIFMTVLTVYTAKNVDFFGDYHFTVAMIIALTKATFVIMFFMGLRWDKGVNIAILFSSIIYVALFIAIILIDVGNRGSLVREEGLKIQIESPVRIEDK